MAASLRINSRHPTADHPLDPYWTPPEATRALMAIERLPASIADPCCGGGVVLDVLRDAGHFVFGADIADYGWTKRLRAQDHVSGKIYPQAPYFATIRSPFVIPEPCTFGARR